MNIKAYYGDIPARKRSKHNLIRILEEFMSTNQKVGIVELDIGEYASVKSARDCIANSAKIAGIPVNVFMRAGNIYIERRDM